MDSPIREHGNNTNLIQQAYLAGLRSVKGFITWLASQVVPTEEDLTQAGVHLGEMHD